MRRYKSVLMISASFLTCAVGAHAQDAATEVSSEAAEEIVVTAQRREQSLSDVGMSISAIGAEALTNRNVTQVEDLAKLVTGLSVSDSGYSQPIYTLRGVGINEPSIGSNSSVAVYVDEVPLTYPSTTQGAALDLQRIEVLKGPQGTLYGQNSTGGAINYIANKPTDTFEAGFKGSYGRFNRASVEGYVSGPLGPTLKARLAGRAQVGGSWQRSITRDDKIGKIKNFTGRAIVDWQPSDSFSLRFNLNGWIDKSDTLVPQLVRVQPGAPALAVPRVVNAPLPGMNARDTDWDPGQDFDRNDKFWQGSVRAEWNLTDELTLISLTSYTHLKRDQFSELDGIGNAVNLRVQQYGKIKSFAQELRLSADFSGVHWMIGANLADDSTNDLLIQQLPDSSQVQNIFGFKSTGGGVRGNQKINNWAVFTNIELPLNDQITVTGGARLSHEKRKFEACGFVLDTASAPAYTALLNVFRGFAGLPAAPLYQPGDCYSFYTTPAVQQLDTAGLPLFTPGLAHRELSENNAPWNVAINYKPGRSSLIYGRISKGYKSGNFSTLNTSDLVAYNPVVQESLLAYEIGGRVAFGRALRLEGALFQYDYNNKQLRARINVGPPFNNINAQDNIPKSRIKGAEASIVASPIRNLTLGFSGTYIKSEILRYTGFTVDGTPNQNFAGSRFNFTPKYSANIDANYSHPITDGLNGFGGVNVAYRSKTSGVFSPPSYTASLSQYDIRAYTLVDGQLGVEAADGTWKAWVWGKNIFDKYYWSNVVFAADVVVKYPGQPATFGASAAFKF